MFEKTKDNIKQVYPDKVPLKSLKYGEFFVANFYGKEELYMAQFAWKSVKKNKPLETEYRYVSMHPHKQSFVGMLTDGDRLVTPVEVEIHWWPKRSQII